MVDISRPSGRGRTWSGVIPTEGGIWSMSEANKGATTGGQDGPSDSGIPAIESIAQISSHLARVAVGRDGKLHANARSEERRVGKECVGTFKSRWSTYH